MKKITKKLIKMSEEKETKKRYCWECGHFDTESMKCACAKGVFYGIRLTEQVADAENGCNEFEEVRYRLTPKGLLHAALHENGIGMSMEEFNSVWERFSYYMTSNGYVKDDEEETERKTDKEE